MSNVVSYCKVRVYILAVGDFKVLRGMFGPKGKEITRDWMK
jgi:hypothetical protein